MTELRSRGITLDGTKWMQRVRLHDACFPQDAFLPPGVAPGALPAAAEVAAAEEDDFFPEYLPPAGDQVDEQPPAGQEGAGKAAGSAV
eukprot:1992341-Heterocapsa_arctica.AAC.1